MKQTDATTHTHEQPFRAAVYARHSRAASEYDAGLDRQLARCLAYVERTKFQLENVYFDLEKSVGQARPGFDRLMSDVKTGRIDVIVVEDLDRLARDAKTLTKIVTALKPGSIVTAGGKGIAVLNAVCDSDAEAARKSMTARQKRGREQAKLRRAGQMVPS